MQGLRTQWDENSISKLKERFNSVIQGLQKDGKVNLDLKDFNNSINKIKSELDAIGKHQIDLKLNTSPIEDRMKQTVKSIDEAIKQYENLGKTSATNIKYDENGNLSSFIIELERAEGLIERIKYNPSVTESIRSGVDKPVAFKGAGVNVTDNTSKVVAQQQQEMDKMTQKVVEDQEMIATKVRQYQESMTLNIQKLKNSYQDSVPNEQLQEFESKLQQLNATDMTNLRTQLKDLDTEFKSINIDSKSAFENSQVQNKETSRVNNLGSLQGNFDSSLLSKSNAEIKSYMQNLLGTSTQIVNLKKSTDGLGNSTVTLTTNTKTANNEIKQEKIVLDQATSGIYKESEAIKEANDNHGGFVDRIKQSIAAVTSFGLITGSVYGTINKIKEGIETINSLNKSMTNISMITGMNQSQVSGLTQQYSKLAGQLHETTSSMMEASENFLRAGDSAEETTQLLKSSTVLSKLAGQSQQEASEGLISIMNSFHLEASDMMSIVDKLVAVDNNAATSTAELTVALQKVAASAASSGVSFEQLVSWIGTISSVTRQSAGSIGNSLNSIFARFESVKEGKKFDPDNQPLNNVEKALNRLGIAMRSDAGTFKSFNDVLTELSAKWKNLNDVEKSEVMRLAYSAMSGCFGLIAGNG